MPRLAHISDLHLTASPLGWRFHDFFSKRVFTWMNLRLRRRHHFSSAEQVLTRLAQDLDERRVDHVIFSGDATALGFESEMRRVAEILGVTRRPGLAVPGNHDYCTPAAARSGAFERCFAPWQQGERVGDETYPFAQPLGGLCLVGLNSAKGNFWFWDASGRVGDAQLQRLRALLARLPAGPRILVTHYPICLAKGGPEKLHHGLRDLPATLQVAAEGGVSLWLHGHRHGFYHFRALPNAPFPVICAGSSTQTGQWSYGEYDVAAGLLHGRRRVYDPVADRFRDAESFELPLASVEA